MPPATPEMPEPGGAEPGVAESGIPWSGPAGASPDKLSVLVISGDFERVHYALVLASAAAAIGMPATLFFTGGALPALAAEVAGGHGSGGWRAMEADGGRTAEAVDAAWCARGVAGFEELLSASADLGVRFIVCEMGLRAIGLEAEDLRGDLPIEVAGVVTFLADASATGAMVTL